MAAALQLIPAGARPLGGGVYQLPARRRGAVAKSSKKKFGPKRSVGIFKRQWVWFGVALVLADALGPIVLAGTAPWLSVPAIALFAYGTYAKKPGAINAAFAIQAAHLIRYWGVTEMLQNLAARAMNRGE